jgi:hypothetical protein
MKIKVIDDHNDVTTIFIRALLRSGLDKDKAFTDKLRADDNFADVILTVNGHELPFAQVVIDSLEENRKYIDEEAANKALEIITECGYTEITKLEEYMREATWKIREQIERVTGVKLREEY